VDFTVVEKDRRYRCPDRIWKPKRARFVHLPQRGKNLLEVSLDVLLYEPTSTERRRGEAACES
jgi:hypothetical protein